MATHSPARRGSQQLLRPRRHTPGPAAWRRCALAADRLRPHSGSPWRSTLSSAAWAPSRRRIGAPTVRALSGPGAEGSALALAHDLTCSCANALIDRDFATFIASFEGPVVAEEPLSSGCCGRPAACTTSTRRIIDGRLASAPTRRSRFSFSFAETALFVVACTGQLAGFAPLACRRWSSTHRQFDG